VKTIPSALQTHLNGDLTTVATCWLITRQDGASFAFTDHDQPITVGGHTYLPQFSYEATAIRTGSEMKLDTLEAKGIFDSSAITDADLQARKFDGALVVIILVNWANPGNGTAILRRATIGQVKRGQYSYQAELRGLARGFQTVITKVYQPECRADLGDSQCKFNISSLQQSGTVVGVSNNWTFNASGLSGPGPIFFTYVANTISFKAPNLIKDSASGFLTNPHTFQQYMEIEIIGSAYNDSTREAQAVQANQITVDGGVTNENAGASITVQAAVAGYFDFGLITWLTGNNAGTQSDVLAWDGTSLIDLLLPTGLPIQVGDTFTITPGCDKRLASCFAKFNNVVNFRGEPFVPGEDAALSYPNAS
jgi:uncharacterized phage protein (TIGR02218 family)